MLGAEALEALVEPLTRGDPQSLLLRWTCQSTRRIAEEPRKDGWTISDCLVDTLSRKMNYSLQGKRGLLTMREARLEAIRSR